MQYISSSSSSSSSSSTLDLFGESYMHPTFSTALNINMLNVVNMHM